MKRYIIRRIAEMAPTTLGVMVLTFLLFHVVGGSPAEVVLGKNATAESLALFDARYGYDNIEAKLRGLGAQIQRVK
jgi:peptide/nickel transport system permease protein